MKKYLTILIIILGHCNYASGKTYDTNTGKIKNTDIAYAVTIEESDTREILMRISLTNNSNRNYNIYYASFEENVGYLTIFFSTGSKCKGFLGGDWKNKITFERQVLGTIKISKKESLERVINLSKNYDVLNKNRGDDIYIYWGLSLLIEDKQNTDKGSKYVNVALPRIGGMLHLGSSF